MKKVDYYEQLRGASQHPKEDRYDVAVAIWANWLTVIGMYPELAEPGKLCAVFDDAAKLIAAMSAEISAEEE